MTLASTRFTPRSKITHTKECGSSPWKEGQRPSRPVPGMSTSPNCSGQAPRDFCFQGWEARGSTSGVVALHGCSCPASDLWPTILLSCSWRKHPSLPQSLLTRLTPGPLLTPRREQVERSRMLPAGQQATWRPIFFMCLQGWSTQDTVGRIMIGDSD